MMAAVGVGNHTAVAAARFGRERIRQFYRDVLGGDVRAQSDEVNRFDLAQSHLCFVYHATALDARDVRKATDLELKAHDIAAARQRILDFAVRTLDVPDPHLCFQVSSSQVFRLVGADEDLSTYEGSPSSRPHS